MNEFNENVENEDGTSYYDTYKAECLNDAKRTFSRTLLAATIYTVAAYVITFALEFVFLLLFRDKYEILEENIYYRFIMGFAPMYIVGLPIYLLICRTVKHRKYEKKKMSCGEFFIIFLISMGIMLVGNIIGVILNTVIGAVLGKNITNSTSELIEQTPIWLIILIVVIIGPIIEELMFRKVMIDRMGRYGDNIAIVTSAVAFGLFHGNFYQFFYATGLGLVLGYVYTKTGNNKINTLLHMIINFFGSVIALFVSEKYERFTEISTQMFDGKIPFTSEFYELANIVFSYTAIYYTLAISGIVLLILCYVKYKINISKECEFIIPREHIASTVIGNTGAILFLTVSAVLMAIAVFLI